MLDKLAVGHFALLDNCVLLVSDDGCFDLHSLSSGRKRFFLCRRY